MTNWHRVCIVDLNDNDHYRNLPWFVNFVHKSGYYDTNEHDIDFYLKPYRARNIKNEPYIEFETEQDYLMFVLRWQ